MLDGGGVQQLQNIECTIGWVKEEGYGWWAPRYWKLVIFVIGRKTFDQVVTCSIWDIDHILTKDITLKDIEEKIQMIGLCWLLLSHVSKIL